MLGGKLGPTGTPKLCLRQQGRQLAKDWGRMKRRQVKVLLTCEGGWLAWLPFKMSYGVPD